MREHGGSAAAAVRAVQAWEPSIPPWAVLGEFSSLRCPRTWAQVHLLTFRLIAASASKAECRFCVEIAQNLSVPSSTLRRQVSSARWKNCYGAQVLPLQPKNIENHRPRTPGFWDRVCAFGNISANSEMDSIKPSSPMQSRHQHQDKHAVLRANVCRDPWTTNSASMFLRWHDTSLGASMWDLLTRAATHGL